MSDVVDAHLHLFPQPQRTPASNEDGNGRAFTGVVEEVREILDHSPIDRVIAITTAASELIRRAAHARSRELGIAAADEEDTLESYLVEQVRAQNAWIVTVAAQDRRFAAAITSDPTIDRAAMQADLEHHLGDPGAVAAIKIHPALSFVFPDHPGYSPTFALAQEAGVPIISHGGTALAGFYASDIDYCEPGRFVPVLEAFPSVRLVIAHLGHPYHDDLVAIAQRFPHVYTDLSFILGHRKLANEELVRVVRAFGIERVLFGSDFPSCDPAGCLEQLQTSGLSSVELEAITGGNANRLFFGVS